MRGYEELCFWLKFPLTQYFLNHVPLCNLRNYAPYSKRVIRCL